MRRRLAMNAFKESLGTKEPCYATGFVSPKTTALFFDKIWLTDEEAERNKVPLSLRLIFDDEDEIIITNAYKDATCNNICYNIAAANNTLKIIDIEKPEENQHSLKTNHFSSEIKATEYFIPTAFNPSVKPQIIYILNNLLLLLIYPLQSIKIDTPSFKKGTSYSVKILINVFDI